MDVLINRQEIKVMNGTKVLKQQGLDADSFKNYMNELSSDKIDMVRTASKLFRSKEWKYKGVKL